VIYFVASQLNISPVEFNKHATRTDTLYDMLEIDYPTYDNIVAPSVSAKILKYVYDNKDLEGFDHLIEVMKNIVFHDRLDK